jgi:RNA polymerase sigma-70 factor (ECF subfamily)
MWSEMDTDAQLITWAMAGDGEAFAHLVDRHQRSVYAYLARRAGAHAAEDLLADVWVAAFRGRASFDTRWESAGSNVYYVNIQFANVGEPESVTAPVGAVDVDGLG